MYYRAANVHRRRPLHEKFFLDTPRRDDGAARLRLTMNSSCPTQAGLQLTAFSCALWVSQNYSSLRVFCPQTEVVDTIIIPPAHFRE